MTNLTLYYSYPSHQVICSITRKLHLIKMTDCISTSLVSGKVILFELDIVRTELFPKLTLRMSKGLLGRHHDDLNGKGTDDNTLSLHAPTQILKID